MNLYERIQKIAERETRPTLNISLRDIISELKKETGISHSTNTIAAVLREMGYDVPDQKRRVFVWKHKRGHE
jgi:transposase